MSLAFARLRAAEILLLPALALRLWIAEVGLSAFGVKRMSAFMPGAVRGEPQVLTTASHESMAVARRAAWLVQGVARRLPGNPRCLAQSLVLRSLLARSGLRVDVILGVRREGEAFGAHAWVEYNGEALQPEAPTHARIGVL